MKADFNELFNAHPITRVPPDVLQEIFSAFAQIDADAPLILSNTCTAYMGGFGARNTKSLEFSLVT